MSTTRIFLAAALLAALAAGAAADTAPFIEHAPLLTVPAGQPVAFRARVRDDQGPPASVTLYVTTSVDAAPFSVPMTATGSGLYVATVPADALRGVGEFRYYLEAVDRGQHTTETRWYVVKVSGGGGGAPPAAGGETPAPASRRPGWVAPAAIAGGAALVIGGVIIASDSGGGGGGGGGGSFSPDSAGNYSGTVNETTREPDGSTSTRSGGITFLVTRDGTVLTDNLHPGQTLQAKVSGLNFLMGATVSDGGYGGQVRYVGNVVQNRIVGTIDGQATSAAGTRTYSGSFSAYKQ